MEQLRGIGEVAAVHGNADDVAVRGLLPSRLELTVGGAASTVAQSDAIDSEAPRVWKSTPWRAAQVEPVAFH
ncbi:MAG: hypothetical protein LC749_17680 [Actinobacteria bacterium]|nr:hypothetical protein [Actinomycetota bacterium]